MATLQELNENLQEIRRDLGSFEDQKRQIVEEENRKNKLLNENIALDEKEGQAKDLEREAQKLNDINKDKNIKM